jgi:cytoskeletal protein CcmA (bactofilin family)
MAENNNSGTVPALLTITSRAAKMEGKFDILESIRIECEVGGELIVGKQLVVGEKGVVTADVQTVDAVIHGTYSGRMTATGTVEIAATGRVTGNIETDSLVISQGGFFNGNVVRTTNGHRDARGFLATIEEKRAAAQM